MIASPWWAFLLLSFPVSCSNLEVIHLLPGCCLETLQLFARKPLPVCGSELLCSVTSGFALPDLAEQFGPPDTAPPLLSRLMEALESRGSSSPPVWLAAVQLLPQAACVFLQVWRLLACTRVRVLEVWMFLSWLKQVGVLLLLLSLARRASGCSGRGCVCFPDLEQLDVASLCSGVLRFLQELPGPILPSVLQADMIRAVQGEVLALAPNPHPSALLSLSVCAGSQRSGTWRTAPRCSGVWPAPPAAPPSTA